jgi:hypothetical protein
MITFRRRGVEQKIPNSTKVLTSTGFKLMGDVNVSDIILDKYENEHIIISLEDYTGVVCELTFQGDNKCDVFGETTFMVSRAGAGMKGVKVYNTDWLCGYYDDQIGKKRPRWPLVDLKPTPIFNTNQSTINTVIDPYTLGFLLGDGCFRSGSSTGFCTVDSFIVDKLTSVHGDNITRWKDNKGGITYNIKGLWKDIKRLGLMGTGSGDKFIPELDYSIADNVNLVQGLMDADGCVNKDSSIEITLKSESMIDTIKCLIERLGGTATKNLKIGKCKEYNFEGVYWRLYVRHPDASLLFSLPRKIDRTKIKPLRNRLLHYNKSDAMVDGKIIRTTASSMVLENYIICNNIGGNNE